MLILLNFGQHGVNWCVAPLAVLLLLNSGIILELLGFGFSRLFAVGHLVFGPLRDDSDLKEATELDDDALGAELDLRSFVTCVLSCFLSAVGSVVTAYIAYLVCRRARQVGLQRVLSELIDYVYLMGAHGGEGRPAPPRMNTRHVSNARKNVERITKRMNELPIEVFKSLEDLRLLPIRDLKEMLRWKRVDYCHLVEKHDLLTALIESDSTSNRTCSICCEDYNSGDLLRILPCKHKYHVECIEKWFMTSSHYTRSPSCPYCNTALLGEEKGI